VTVQLNNDNRTLMRALQIERASRKLFERRLRALMVPIEFQDFRRFVRQEALRDVESKCQAKVTTDWPDGA